MAPPTRSLEGFCNNYETLGEAHDGPMTALVSVFAVCRLPSEKTGDVVVRAIYANTCSCVAGSHKIPWMKRESQMR